jgi:hypothetical protein
VKYVILQSPSSLPAVVMAFAPLTHAELAEPWLAKGHTVASAGFVRFDRATGRLVPYGESTSLKAASAPDDELLLNALYQATPAPR